MSDNKKYYYLKLKDNFYDREEIVVLEGMPDGVLYSNILMKLYLKSLKSEGRLMFNDRIPYDPNMLAMVTRQPVAVVEKALGIFRSMGLIDILDNGAIYMLDIQNFIGRGSSEGDRKREFRAKINKEKELLLTGGHLSDNRPPEKELELELEIENRAKAKLAEAGSPLWQKISQWLGRTSPSLAMVEDIQHFRQVAKMSEEVLLLAVDEAISHKAKSWKYVCRILERWEKEGLTTPEQVDAVRTAGKSEPRSQTAQTPVDPNAAKFEGMEDWNG